MLDGVREREFIASNAPQKKMAHDYAINRQQSIIFIKCV